MLRVLRGNRVYGEVRLTPAESHPCRGIELRRTTPLPHCPADGCVFQFLAAGRATQHEATATHVTTADEGRREQQAIAKDREQHLDVLPGGDAPEQYDVAIRSEARTERARALLERATVARVREIDWLSGKRLDRFARHGDIGSPQTGVRRNDQHSTRNELIGWIRRLAEAPRVRQLPPEVETAHKCKHVSECDTLRGPQLHRQRKLSRVGHDLPRADASAIGRGQQENSMPH